MLAYLGEILLLPASEIEQEEEEACVSGGSCLYFVGDSSMRASSSHQESKRRPTTHLVKQLLSTSCNTHLAFFLPAPEDVACLPLIIN